jgi:nucleoside-diphosphate-sugar epimerase
MQRILVTGSGGFLGTHVVKELRGANTDQRFRFFLWDTDIYGTLLDPKNQNYVLDQIRPDSVVHLAWNPTSDKNYDTDFRNLDWVEASSSLAEKSLRLGARIILTGSAIESQAIDLNSSPYQRSKTMLFEYYQSRLARENALWISPKYLFSMAHKKPRLCEQMISQKDDFVLRNPDQENDFIEVRDAAAKLSSLILNGDVGIRHIGTGTMRSNKSFQNATNAATSWKLLNCCDIFDSGFPAPLNYSRGPNRELNEYTNLLFD